MSFAFATGLRPLPAAFAVLLVLQATPLAAQAPHAATSGTISPQAQSLPEELRTGKWADAGAQPMVAIAHALREEEMRDLARCCGSLPPPPAAPLASSPGAGAAGGWR